MPLKLHAEEVLMLQDSVHRGQSSPMPPTDPLIYRFYEIVRVLDASLPTLSHALALAAYRPLLKPWPRIGSSTQQLPRGRF